MGSAVGSLIPPGARSFGKYELLARLAVGGMAEIFLARRRGADGAQGMVCIKRILPHLAEDERFVAMFRDEARLAARIEHRNVCQVLELGTVGDIYFIAMEYLHGVPLSRILLRSSRTNTPLDVRFVAAIIQQSCAGLESAHELTSQDGRLLDVVHRDVSPPNIFVTALGVVKLLDFGVAKARGASQKTRTGTVKGKNAYMSPEQVLGEPIDRRSDLFSLGTVMWESLTASRLFLRDTDFETFRSITRGELPKVTERRLDTPPAVAAVVERALERDKEKRFDRARDLGDAILAAVADRGGPSSEEEIARYLAAHFSKELEAKTELLTSATAPADRRRMSGRLPVEEEADLEVTLARPSGHDVVQLPAGRAVVPLRFETGDPAPPPTEAAADEGAPAETSASEESPAAPAEPAEPIEPTDPVARLPGGAMRAPGASIPGWVVVAGLGSILVCIVLALLSWLL